MILPVPAFTMIEVPDIVIWYLSVGFFFFWVTLVMAWKEAEAEYSNPKIVALIVAFCCTLMWPIAAFILSGSLWYEWKYIPMKKRQTR